MLLGNAKVSNGMVTNRLDVSIDLILVETETKETGFEVLLRLRKSDRESGLSGDVGGHDGEKRRFERE
jgi:hypothetical protein